MLCLSYYCLCFLFNKIRGARFCLEVREWGDGREGGRNDPNNVCTYEYMNKEKKTCYFAFSCRSDIYCKSAGKNWEFIFTFTYEWYFSCNIKFQIDLLVMDPLKVFLHYCLACIALKRYSQFRTTTPDFLVYLLSILFFHYPWFYSNLL
jgi:hypothetical protein